MVDRGHMVECDDDGADRYVTVGDIGHRLISTPQEKKKKKKLARRGFGRGGPNPNSFDVGPNPNLTRGCGTMRSLHS